MKVVDLSADFRLRDIDEYKEWYGDDHRAPELQEEVVYGLTEINRDKIKDARVIANPVNGSVSVLYACRSLDRHLAFWLPDVYCTASIAGMLSNLHPASFDTIANVQSN